MKTLPHKDFLIASIPVYDPEDHMHLFPDADALDEAFVNDADFRKFIEFALEEPKFFDDGEIEAITKQLSLLMAIYFEISNTSEIAEEDQDIPSIKLAIANACLPYISSDMFRHNCYSYAAKGTDEAMPRSPFYSKANPGETAGKEITSRDKLTKEEMISLSEADGLTYVGDDIQNIEIPEGKRLIVLYLSDRDYHWTRIDRTHDDRLVMSGKLGSTLVAITELQELCEIYEQDFGGDYRFSGFFLTDEMGIDVGLDARYRSQGLILKNATREEVDLRFLEILLKPPSKLEI